MSKRSVLVRLSELLKTWRGMFLLFSIFPFVSIANDKAQFKLKPTAVLDFKYDSEAVHAFRVSYTAYTKFKKFYKESVGKEKRHWVFRMGSLIKIRRVLGDKLLIEFLTQAKKSANEIRARLTWKIQSWRVQCTKDLNWIAFRAFDENQQPLLSAYFKFEGKEADNVKTGKTFFWAH